MSDLTRFRVNERPRLKALICEISFRECCYMMAKSPLVIDPVFLPKGLHDIGQQRMLTSLQQQIDAVDPALYSHTLLVYGLCNNGIAGLRSTRTPLVVPRAHDCITFFFGSTDRYQEYFDAHPGTYFQTTGWEERNSVNPDQKLPGLGDASGSSPVGEGVMTQLGLNRTYEEYVRKYGEENARYILEITGNWVKNYSRFTYIDMGIADDLGYQAGVRAEADKRGWTYEELQGDRALLQDLFYGRWDESRFLTVPVGKRILASHNGDIIRAEE